MCHWRAIARRFAVTLTATLTTIAPSSVSSGIAAALPLPGSVAAIARDLLVAILPDRQPLQVEQLDRPAERLPDGVVRRDTLSQTDLTEPSLWWAADRFGNKLLDTWLAYPQQRRIDLVVNAQFWSLLDYLERYEFVNHMGTVARGDRYNLRVFDRQQPDLVLAAYTCIFQVEPIVCRVDMERSGSSGFRGSGF